MTHSLNLPHCAYPPQGEAAQQSARAFCAAVTAPTQQADGPASMKKPDWAPGTPASGREQTLGEAFAAMQHHGRGARKVHTTAVLACLVYGGMIATASVTCTSL